MGSGRTRTDSSGALAGAFTSFGDFGNLLTAPADPSLPSFTGYEHDAYTGLEYAKNRYYDPATAGFMKADTWPITPDDKFSINRYLYASSNPINLTDPLGYFNWSTNTTQTGDTLSNIAYVLDTTWQELWNLNKAIVPNPDFLQVGLVLNIPSCVTAVCATRLEEARNVVSGQASKDYQKTPTPTPTPPTIQIFPTPNPGQNFTPSDFAINGVIPAWLYLASATCALQFAGNGLDHTLAQIFSVALQITNGKLEVPIIGAGPTPTSLYGCADIVETDSRQIHIWEVKSRGAYFYAPKARSNAQNQLLRYIKATGGTGGYFIEPFYIPKPDLSYLLVASYPEPTPIHGGMILYQNERQIQAAVGVVIAADLLAKALSKYPGLRGKVAMPGYNPTGKVLNAYDLGTVLVVSGSIVILLIAGVIVVADIVTVPSGEGLVGVYIGTKAWDALQQAVSVPLVP